MYSVFDVKYITEEVPVQAANWVANSMGVDRDLSDIDCQPWLICDIMDVQMLIPRYPRAM
jgi:hypothetical protein